MSFDINKTLSLIKGGLLDHRTTWQSYLGENPGWIHTVVTLTAPLMVVNVLLSLVFSRIAGGYAYYALHSNFFMALVLSLIMATVGIAIAAFVFSFLAGTFKGKHNFDRAVAAISLAAIPAWVAGPIAALVPFIGFFVALAGGIMSLVFLYRIMPLALEVPDEKRTVHFITSLVAVVVLNAIVGSFMGFGGMGSDMRSSAFSKRDTTSRSVTGFGMFGEIERQGRLINAANSDAYTPPDDGELTEAQVRDYIKVLEKTRAIQEEYAKKMQKLSDDMQAKEEAGKNLSLTDLTRMYSGVSTIASAGNAEMEVVITGQGNWAEHSWVKEQLRTAHIQRGDGSDAMAHNYELYKKYVEELFDE